MELQVSFQNKQQGRVTVIQITGALDASSSEDFKAYANALIERDKNQLVVDLSGIPFMDSSGLGALVSLFKRVRAREGDLKLAAANETVHKVFTLTRLDRVFDLCADVETAIEEFEE